MRRVVVTGLGAVTPLGIDAPSTWEAAVAGRLCGERERAMRITRRALDLLADGGDPARTAWFWVQRSLLTEGLSRGDGWKELATAQDLMRGLPPSEMHAEVLSRVAGWAMLHAPGPDALSDAQRAVEYARMVGAEDIELNARLTLGGLMVDAGDVDTGIAVMEEVRRRALERGPAAVVGRSYVNLPSCLEGIGRSTVSIMPKLARSQRLVELAVMKNCEWIASSDFALLPGVPSMPAAALPQAESDR